MDVSLSGRFVFSLILALCFAGLVSCGNRYDLSTEAGRQSRIDDANFHLSKGECAAADEAIQPLYASPYVNAEVRIVKASALACYARFNMLKFAAGIVGASNYFQALAKSLDNAANDGARSRMYEAVDVLTQGTAALGAGQRTTDENTYMVFLQFGVISAVIRNYGSPKSDGSKGTNLIYDTTASPAGEMSDVDACALAAAFSHISDSFANSDLNDSESTAIVSSLNSVCSGIAGITSCTQITRNRSLCDGTNTNSVRAEGIKSGVNTGWQ